MIPMPACHEARDNLNLLVNAVVDTRAREWACIPYTNLPLQWRR